MLGKRRYSDEEKAAALLGLEANGGNLLRTSREFGVPIATLSNWRDGHIIPAVSDIQNKNRKPLIDRLTDELHKAIEAMDGKRGEASYSDLARTVGIFTDKVQLLSGQDTERVAARVHVTYGTDATDESEADDAGDA